HPQVGDSLAAHRRDTQKPGDAGRHLWPSPVGGRTGFLRTAWLHVAFLGTAAPLRRRRASLAALMVTTVRANHSVAQASGAPSAGRRPFGVGRRLDVVCHGPGKPFFGAETATVPPALFGSLAAARMILTG